MISIYKNIDRIIDMFLEKKIKHLKITTFHKGHKGLNTMGTGPIVIIEFEEFYPLPNKKVYHQMEFPIGTKLPLLSSTHINDHTLGIVKDYDFLE